MDLINRIRNDIDSRLDELRPQIEEIPRLESVLAALEAAGDGQSSSGGARPTRGRGRPRSTRGAAAATTSRTSRPRQRARRGQRREEFLQLVKGHPEITIAEAARQIGVSPPQISTLVRRLEDEGAIQRADGRFVLVAPAASEAPTDEVVVIEGDEGSPEEETQGPGVEGLEPDAGANEEELAPDAGANEDELEPDAGANEEELAPEAGSSEEELAPEAARDEAGRPQAT